ncbi:MAG: hypothetical protein ABIH71_00455, partial [Candidatus Omnitrophota bacterium]
MNKNMFLKFIFFVLLITPCVVFAGGIAGNGQYHYLAEEEAFNNEVFYVNRNVTVFENGAVLQEEWDDKGTYWEVYLKYWRAGDLLSGDPFSPIKGKELDTKVVSKDIKDVDPDKIHFQSIVTFVEIQDKLNEFRPRSTNPEEDSTLAINLSLPLLRADIYDEGRDMGKPACVLIPGYTAGIPTASEVNLLPEYVSVLIDIFWRGSNSEDRGWNNGGAMTETWDWVKKASARIFGPTVIISYNTHEDHDGLGLNNKTGNNYDFGILWKNGSEPGAIDKAVDLLTKRMGITLENGRVVSYSTGHYLSMKILNKIAIKEYWAISPLTRGSTLIGTHKWKVGDVVIDVSQDFDCYEDMLRHNFRNEVYGDVGKRYPNENILKIAEECTPNNLANLDTRIMLSLGDSQSGGNAGSFLGNITDVGVVSYGDDADTWLRPWEKKYLKYEAIRNLSDLELKNFGGKYKLNIWNGPVDTANVEKTPADTDNKMSDLTEHWTIDMRLDVIGKNDTTGLGARLPIQSIGIDNKWEISDSTRGVKINWERGQGDDNKNTIGYEVLRWADGDNQPWRVGWSKFSGDNYNLTDNLLIEVKGLDYPSRKIIVDQLSMGTGPLMRPNFNCEIWMLEGEAKFKRFKIETYWKDCEKKEDYIFCSEALAGIKTGDKFIIRGIKYGYSIRTWGVDGTFTSTDAGSFVSDSSKEVFKNIAFANLTFKESLKIVPNPAKSNPALGFKVIDTNEQIELAQYCVDDGSWIDLIPIDGIYDELEEIFSATISTLELLDGSHKVEVVAYNVVGDEVIAEISFVLDTHPPPLLANFTIQSGNSQLTLTWQNPADTDFAGVVVYRSINDITSLSRELIQTQAVEIYDGKDSTFTDTGLTNDKRYYYSAFSYDSAGNYAEGVEASGIPLHRPLTLAILFDVSKDAVPGSPGLKWAWPDYLNVVNMLTFAAYQNPDIEL